MRIIAEENKSMSVFKQFKLMIKKIALLFLIAVVHSACVQTKEITYFQPKSLTSDIEKVNLNEQLVIKLQPGDIIKVFVNSLSPEANTMFNIFPETQTQMNQVNSTIPAIGFLVDSEGAIILPLTGKMIVGGLSPKDAADLISKKLEKYLEQPTVSVRLMNFKISVLGEVARPSLYSITNERVTLPEALSLAGDLTIYGKRQNVLIIREVDGKREFARIDLTQRDLFTSPYYYLRPNDIVYVEPLKGKLTSTSRAVQLAPIAISLLTFLTIITQNILIK